MGGIGVVKKEWEYYTCGMYRLTYRRRGGTGYIRGCFAYRTRAEPEAGMQNSRGRYPVCAEKRYVVVQLAAENPHTQASAPSHKAQ